MNFSCIDRSRNNFSRDASMLFGKDKGCQVLDVSHLSRNNFEFDFLKVSFMNEYLVILDIPYNMIYEKKTHQRLQKLSCCSSRT